MGGSPTNTPNEYSPQKEQASYDRLEKQRMSDQGIVAPEQIIPAVKGLAKELKQGVEKKFFSSPTGTPNAYSREASKPASFTSESEQAIDQGLK